MRRFDRNRQFLAFALAFLAGEVDAAGFIVGGGYFTSFMSGNTTRMGVEMQASAALSIIPLLLIGSFVGGVIMGAMIAIKYPGRHKRMLLASVAILLGIGALALAQDRDLLFLAAAAFAMGAANNVFSRDGEVTVGVTYMTGALVRTGQGLAARMLGRAADGMRGYPTLWLALAAGAACGAALFTFEPVAAAAFSALFATCLFGLAIWIETRAS